MKKFIIICLLVGYSYSSFAAKLFDVVQPVLASFKKQYPGALYATWQILEDNNTYAVRFVYYNQSLVAYYDEDGTAIGFEKLVAPDKLPVKAKATLDEMFTGYKILSAEELLLYNKHLFYFEISNKEERLFVSIYDNGKIKKVHR